jgi:hypothetical protein
MRQTGRAPGYAPLLLAAIIASALAAAATVSGDTRFPRLDGEPDGHSRTGERLTDQPIIAFETRLAAS